MMVQRGTDPLPPFCKCSSKGSITSTFTTLVGQRGNKETWQRVVFRNFVHKHDFGCSGYRFFDTCHVVWGLSWIALGHPETHFKLCIRTLQHGWSKPGGHSTICSAMRTWVVMLLNMVGCWLLTLEEELSNTFSCPLNHDNNHTTTLPWKKSCGWAVLGVEKCLVNPICQLGGWKRTHSSGPWGQAS